MSEWMVCQLYWWAAFWQRIAIAIDRGLLSYLIEKRLNQMHELRSETSRFLRGAPAEAHELSDLKLDLEAEM
jgi:hypothetical protein